MKVGVIGSRSFNDYDLLQSELRKITEITCIVSGGAQGADILAERYARQNRIPTQIFYPDWQKFGKRAGFLRNSDIVRNSELIIAFWNGESNGTRDSIRKAKDLGIPVTVILFEEKEKQPIKDPKGRIVPL